MRLFFILTILSLLPQTFWGAELVKKNQVYQFGTQDLSLTFNATTGSWIGLWSQEKQLLGMNNEHVSADAILNNWRGLDQGKSASLVRKITRIQKKGKDVLEIDTAVHGYVLTTNVQLYPKEQMVRFRYILRGPADHTEKIRGIQHQIPLIPFGKESAYTLPAKYPPETVHLLTPGRRQTHWLDPNPLIVQLNPSQSILFVTNLLVPWGDRGRVIVVEEDHDLNIKHRLDCAGMLKPGETMTSGDFWCVLKSENLHNAFTAFRTWQKMAGQKVVEGRSPKLKNTILYSFHPGGAIGHAFTDWGGFVETTGRLPRLQTLNCNTIWMLPVEDECCYIPDDYYKMQVGVGTPEEYKALVRKAHELGFTVWQDLVAHGGTKYNKRATTDLTQALLQYEDGSIPRVRCFDYGNPDWQKYMADWASYFMKTYGVDGFRLDASAGSHTPNWRKDIPYSRASMACGQGGLGMQRAIRQAVRKNRPDGAILAEIEGSAYASTSDILYDFTFAYQATPSLRKLEPEAFTWNLSHWLWEQQFTDPEDLQRMRFIDSQDMVDSPRAYGPLALRAVMALTAWIDGVPMLYKEMEEGNFDCFRRILKLRKELPELNSGKADYISCDTTQGVYAWMRQNKNNLAIPVINFNPHAVNATVSFPADRIISKQDFKSAQDLWNGNEVKLTRDTGKITTNIALPAYGFTVLRMGDKATVATPHITIPGKNRLTAEAWLLKNNGSRKRIDWSLNNGRFSAELYGNTGILVQIPLNGRKLKYRIRHAGGVIEDDFRTRHPSCESLMTNIYTLPQGGNLLWSSVFSPFGLSEESAEISLFDEKSSIKFTFSSKDRPGAVFLLDRLDNDHNPWLFIVKKVPGSTIACNGRKVSFKVSTADTDNSFKGSGDPRLIPIAGGWLFDNGKIRLRIGATGSLISASRKNNSGKWTEVFHDFQPVIQGGYTTKKRRFLAEYDVEAFSLFDRKEDGTLVLQFFGHPRGKEFFELLAPNTVDYAITYTLNDSEAFGYTCGMRPLLAATQDQMLMALSCQVNDRAYPIFTAKGEKLAAGRFVFSSTTSLPDQIEMREGGFKFSQLQFNGPQMTEIDMNGKELLLYWHKHSIPKKQLGIRRTVSGLMDLCDAPVIERSFAEKEQIISFFNGVTDPSFERENFASWPLTARGMINDNAWVLPTEGMIVPEYPHSGKQSLKIIMENGEERFASQVINPSRLKAGEVWRLSIYARGKDLKKLPTKKSAIELRFSNPSTQGDRRTKAGRYTKVVLPVGSFEYSQFYVDFTVPETWNGLSIQLGGTAQSGIIWFDDVKLECISPKK